MRDDLVLDGCCLRPYMEQGQTSGLENAREGLVWVVPLWAIKLKAINSGDRAAEVRGFCEAECLVFPISCSRDQMMILGIPERDKVATPP